MAIDATETVSALEIQGLDAYWRAANYLTVGQIYLQDNPLLREPLRPEHIKPRLLGHWGTSPGLSLLYVHLNRLIRQRDLDVVSTWPVPATAVRRWSPTSTSRAPTPRSIPMSREDAEGLRRLFRQFSTPGGIPSHVSVPTPGSIHEGGELGYALVHAVRRRLRQPRSDRRVRGRRRRGRDRAARGLVEGRSSSSTRPATARCCRSCTSTATRSPARRCWAARPTTRSASLLERPRLRARVFVEGDDPAACTASSRTRSTACSTTSPSARSRRARAATARFRSRWPAIVLRTPKGWTGPEDVDGVPVEGTFRAHQVPLANVRSDPDHLRMLEEWMRSYRPEELFDDERPAGSRARGAGPEGDGAMGANPHANGGRLLVALDLPDFAEYAVAVPQPGDGAHGVDPAARRAAARRVPAERRPTPTSGCSARTRRTPTGSARSSRSRTADLGPDRSTTPTTSSPPTAG